MDLIKQHFAIIKEIYLETQSNSVYPFINKMELSEFCSKTNMMDDRLNLANADLLFVSSIQKHANIKNKSGLIRHEFLEFLVRMVKFKYIETGIHVKYADAFRMMIEEHIKPNFSPEWQQFRDRELWTVEVNDVLSINLEGVKRVQSSFFTATQKFMSSKDAINMMTRDTSLMMSAVQAKQCLSYCKMTVRDEMGEFEKYSRL